MVARVWVSHVCRNKLTKLAGNRTERRQLSTQLKGLVQVGGCLSAAAVVDCPSCHRLCSWSLENQVGWWLGRVCQLGLQLHVVLWQPCLPCSTIKSLRWTAAKRWSKVVMGMVVT